MLTFEDVDRALQEAVEIRRNSLAAKNADRVSVNAALRQLQRSSSVFVGIGWTDASGEMLAHSFGQTPPRGNIAGMSHFSAQRDGAGDQLIIAPPFLSASGKWMTGVSRRLSNTDGSFAGVVTAAIDQSYFTKLYRSIDLGKADLSSCCTARGVCWRGNRKKWKPLESPSPMARCLPNICRNRRRAPTRR